MTTRARSAAPRKDPATGTWFFIVDGGVGADGQRRQVKRRGFRTKALAAEALDAVRGKARTRSYVKPSKQSVGEYLDGWVAALPNRLRPSTVDSYRRCLLYLTPTLRATRLDALTAEALDRLYAELRVTGRRQKEGGLSPRSIRYVHTVIRAALADAVKKGTLDRNVADAADPPRSKDAKPPEMGFWTPTELATFLKLTADDPLGPLYRTAAMCGLRRGEVCGLRWQDVDFDKARIHIRHTLIVVRSSGATDGGLRFSEPKTDKGRRVIDLDPVTLAALKTQQTRQAAWKLATGAGWANEHGLCFTEPGGRPLDPESVGQRFNRRVARAGVPRISFHGLRHSHCAALIAAGEGGLLIARRLGHHSAAFSLDRYGHLFEQAGSEAAAAVAAMVDGGF
jgi:integrase